MTVGRRHGHGLIRIDGRSDWLTTRRRSPPTDDFAGTGSVTVTAGGYTDAAGNAGAAAADKVAIDRPTRRWRSTSSMRSLSDGDNSSAGDLHLQRGAGRLRRRPTSRPWAARSAGWPSPADPLGLHGDLHRRRRFAGTGSVTVTAGSYTDAAGNTGAGGTDTVAIDTANPTVTVDIVDAR